MPPLLTIKDLSIDFITETGISTAVKNISFQVDKGEVVAIVGESGSGKTVTSLAILQLLVAPPAHYSSGQIILSQNNTEVDLLKMKEDEIRNIRGSEVAMIFQEPMTSLNPVLTCGEQVMETVQLHKNLSNKEAKENTLQLFDKVKLPEPSSIFYRYPHQLSGGQKQRVMIAMALSSSPSLLIADEPTTALDVTVQKTILRLISDLQKETEMSVMYITHDLGLVAEIANKVIVMYKGGIVEQGDVQDIFRNPVHPYTRALLACRPINYVKGQRLQVVEDFLNNKIEDNGSAKKQPVLSNIDAENIVLRVENLKVYFPTRKNIFGKILEEYKAVDGVSFSVAKGETVGLVGESGCGKTTLGRAIIRLIKPTSGNIFLQERDIATIPDREMLRLRKKIQIIFQDPYGSLNPRLTIGEAISEPMKVQGISLSRKARKEKAISLLEKVNLKAEHYNRYPHEFSGGQRQRICIARALGLDPEFIICDESVSALDVSVQAQVLNLLNDLKEEFGFTSIFISHDLSVVRYVSDRIMVMQKGKIIETGSSEEIYNNPRNPYTAELINAIPKGLVKTQYGAS